MPCYRETLEKPLRNSAELISLSPIHKLPSCIGSRHAGRAGWIGDRSQGTRPAGMTVAVAAAQDGNIKLSYHIGRWDRLLEPVCLHQHRHGSRRKMIQVAGHIIGSPAFPVDGSIEGGSWALPQTSGLPVSVTPQPANAVFQIMHVRAHARE